MLLPRQVRGPEINTCPPGIVQRLLTVTDTCVKNIQRVLMGAEWSVVCTQTREQGPPFSKIVTVQLNLKSAQPQHINFKATDITLP